MILPLVPNGGGGVKGNEIYQSVKNLNKAKFNHFNPMDI